jgi:serine/threonine protein kinase
MQQFKRHVFCDRYILTDELPRKGGTSRVFRARDLQGDVPEVAIKIFESDGLDNSVLKEFFLRERDALFGLKHPNIVAIHDAGFDTTIDRYYIVLEWMNQSLPDLLALRPVPKWDVFSNAFLAPILEGLAAAHSRQIIHRDIKPKNILIGSGDIPKLAEFGISQLLALHYANMQHNRMRLPK